MPSGITTFLGEAKLMLLPSSSEAFRAQVTSYGDQGMIIDESLASEEANLQKLLRQLTVTLRQSIEYTLAQSEDKKSESLSVFSEQLQLFEQVKARYTYVQMRRKELENLSAGLASQKATGYSGLSDWAAMASEAYSELFTVLSAIGFVGMGLTYTTIFSASRGNLALISWSFSLFVIVVVLPSFVQTSLKYSSKLPAEYPLLNPSFWDGVIAFFAYTSCIALMAAIILLVLTVYLLSPSQIQTSGFSGATGPRQAAWFALAVFIFCAVASLNMMICVLGVTIVSPGTLRWGNILVRLMRRRNIEALRRKREVAEKELVDFDF